MNETERRRRERSLFAVLLLFGICILLYVGQIAIGIAPNWEVAANMRSNLDPNIDFMTNRNSGIVEPLNPDILTLPAWFYLFTPNATMPTNAGFTPPPTQVPTRASTQVPTQPATLPPTIVNTFPVTPPTKKPPFPVKTSTPTFVPNSADLQITKTDGSPTYFAGGVVVYQIVASNPSGPKNISGAIVTDTIPAKITSANWICVSAGGATCTPNGAGNINALVNLPVGSSVTYTIVGAISASASGNLVNSAHVSLPAGFSDPVPANNTATDSDALALHSADLRITKTDGPATYTVGGSTTYTITVSNSGATSVTGARVTDNFDVTRITSATWTCAPAGGATCTAGGSGNINELVNLPVGSSVTYTVTATISPSASGDLVNTASVNLPSGYGDTNPADNTATDTDTPVFTANLSITKDDGSTTYTVGGSTTYTIVVSNSGPANVTGAVVTDLIPPQVASWSWTCTSQLNGASGCDPATNNSSDFSDTVNLPVGSSLTYTVTAAISPSASGLLGNTASVNWPTGSVTRSATDTDTPVFVANLSISKDDSSTAYNVGGSTTYTIVVSNSGPADVTGAVVTDPIPSQIASWDWTCTSQLNGASGCDPVTNSSSGFSDTVYLPVGSSITYTVDAAIKSSAFGNLDNTASVNLPAGFSAPLVYTATDTDTPVFIADLQISKTDVPAATTYLIGDSITYEIIVSNLLGPADVTNATVTDNFDISLITSANWICATSAGSAVCPNVGGSGDISELVDLPVGSSLTYTVNATISPSASSNLDNTASVDWPAGSVNISASDTDAPLINIGPPDTTVYSVPKGSPLTIVLSSPITAGGDGNPDFVYYERPNCTGVCMDFVKVEISPDGSSWIQVFYWGDPPGINFDANTNVSQALVGGICQVAGVPTEVDDCDIPAASLYPYPGTGIAIDIDSLGLSGTYPWIRITSPADGMNTAEIDAIQPLP